MQNSLFLINIMALRKFKKYTEKEIQSIISDFKEGVPIEEIAPKWGRTETAILEKLYDLDIISAEYLDKKINFYKEQYYEGFNEDIILKVLERDKHKCIYCQNNEDLSVHHIIPASQGGKHDLSNLVTLCKRCHYFLHGEIKIFDYEKRLKLEMMKTEINFLELKEKYTRFLLEHNKIENTFSSKIQLKQLVENIERKKRQYQPEYKEAGKNSIKVKENIIESIENYMENRDSKKEGYPIPKEKKERSLVWKLGESDDLSSILKLIEFTKSKNSNERRLSASALGKLAKFKPQIYKACPHLIKLLSDEKPQVRQYAAKALGKIECKKASLSLKKLLNDKKDYVRKSAKYAIKRIRK